MHVLDICKNEEDTIKNEVPRVATTFLPLIMSMAIFPSSRADDSTVHDQIRPNFQLIRDFMVW